MDSSPIGFPFSSIIASLSPSGSVAIPKSDLVSITIFDISDKLWGRGSAPLLKLPSALQFNSVMLHENCFSNRGNIFEVELLTASTTILYFFFLICSRLINDKFIMLFKCLFIASSL